MKYAILTLALTGCAGMSHPVDYNKMSAEQIKALSQDRSILASCVVTQTVWGTIKSVFVQMDRGTTPNGSVTVNPDCAVNAGVQQKTETTTTVTRTVPAP